MKMKMKKSAVDLTDLAIGIVVLGIVVTIGAVIMLNIRDSTLEDLPILTTTNESVDASATGSDTFANTWVSSTSATCINASNGVEVGAGNYSVAVGTSGVGTISNATATAGYNYPWNCTYTTYDTTQANWALPDATATGLAEYGNWFDIIVIVGVAGVILSLIFMAFGKSGSGNTSVSY